MTTQPTLFSAGFDGTADREQQDVSVLIEEKLTDESPAAARIHATPMPAQVPASMTQSQRDMLIAEVLGDVGRLCQQVEHVSTQMQSLSELVNVQDYAHWRETLDAKLLELSSINLSEHASSRLQAHAQDYLGALAKQVDDMVSAKVQERVAQTLTFERLFTRLQQDWLMRLSSISACAFAGTLLALAVWRVF